MSNESKTASAIFSWFSLFSKLFPKSKYFKMSILSKLFSKELFIFSNFLNTQILFKIIFSKAEKSKFSKSSNHKNLHIKFTFRSLDKLNMYFNRIL